ncbi:MAG TPA: hypothetical protein VGL44_16915 [Gaiellales bacterium]|jgi:hypothetical protein
MKADSLGGALVLVMAAAFIAGLAVIANVLPNPSEGPTPPGTRVAYDVLVAACAVALAAIPLAMRVVDRGAGSRPALAWRVVAVAGAALAMLVLGWGVRTWAYPPHNLRQCFPRDVCESGRVNVPLGLRRLNEGVAGALVVLVATTAVAGRLAPRLSSAITDDEIADLS